jgi:hypothetical protein
MDRSHLSDQQDGGLRPRPVVERRSSLPAGASNMLRLQAAAGNRATSMVVARLRAEGEPIEPEPGRTTSGAVGPAPAEDDEPVQRAVPVQRQTLVGRSPGELARAVVQRHRIPSQIIGPPPEPEADAGPVQANRDVLQRDGPAAPAAASVAYPAYAAVVGNATISSATGTAWTETKGATSDGSRREQGFWVRWNKDTGAMAAAGLVTAPTVGNATTASVNLGARPADSGANYTVGSFHTHTPTTFRSVARPVGPSAGDTAADGTDNVTGLVYDYDSPDASGNIPARHPLNSAAHLWHSGPDRRT